MSFQDRKALVILSILYKLVEVYYKESDKDTLLHRIQLLIAEYKIGLKKSEHSWIKHYINRFSITIEEEKIEAEPPFIVSLLFMVAEEYRMVLKNPRRVAAWESVENFVAKNKELNNAAFSIHYDAADKINSLLFNDDLYL